MVSFVVIAFLLFPFANGQLNNSVIRQTRPLSSSVFDEIMIDGAFDIFLSRTTDKNSTSTVEIETTIDIQNNIIVEIINNHILFIHMHDLVKIEKNIYGYIRFQSPLRRYTIKGNGNTMTDDNGISNENNDTFILENRGVANVAFRLNVNQFQFDFTGTGNSRFWGQVREQATFDAKGVGDINALNLSTKKGDVYATGVSIIRVAATEDLQIEVTGVSNVYYRLPVGKKPTKAISNGLGKLVAIS